MNNNALQNAEVSSEMTKLSADIERFVKVAGLKRAAPTTRIGRVKAFLRKVVFSKRLKREAKITALKRQLYAIATEMLKVFEAYSEALDGVGAIEQLGNRAPNERVRAKYNKEYRSRIGQAMMYMSALDQSLSFYLASRYDLTLLSPEEATHWHPLSHAAYKPMLDKIESYRKDCETAGLIKQN